MPEISGRTAQQHANILKDMEKDSSVSISPSYGRALLAIVRQTCGWISKYLMLKSEKDLRDWVEYRAVCVRLRVRQK